jgi:hypothetical protein
MQNQRTTWEACLNQRSFSSRTSLTDQGMTIACQASMIIKLIVLVGNLFDCRMTAHKHSCCLGSLSLEVAGFSMATTV